MSSHARPIRVLQSFPHKIGAGRITDTAWHQAAGVARAGGSVLSMPSSVNRPLPPVVKVRPTLAVGPARLPYRLVGDLRAIKLHDRMVALALPLLKSRIDLVHAWPVGALETLRAARRLGIPTVLERPNAHTRFAYEAVARESARIGVALPPGTEHAYDAETLAREEQEYALADRLLCPSDFVVRTFLAEGVPGEKLVRHQYGFEPGRFHPDEAPDDPQRGLVVLFAGLAAVRKGLHTALDAWIASPASRHGRLLIAGTFVAEYRERLAERLAHPSVEVLGQRDDIPELMRRSDILVLPSVEEGSALVCGEAVASGCVLLVSDASSAVAEHGVNALVHEVGDVGRLTADFTLLDADRGKLAELRAGALRSAGGHTWDRAGERLLEVYAAVIER